MKSLFLISLLFCLLLAGCMSQVVKIRSDVGVEKYSATVRGYMRKPKGDGPFPAVILMHGCSGLEGSVLPGLQNHASYLVRNGFATLILDSFGPRGTSGYSVCRSNIELASARSYRIYDAYHGLVFLKNQPFVDTENIFLVGQSNGGSVALLVTGSVPFKFSKNTRFRAVVAYYPWCRALPHELISPLLIFGAGQDDWVSPIGCQTRERFITGEEIEVVIYPNAHHSFDLPISVQTYAGHTVGGNYKATIDSRKNGRILQKTS